MTPSRYPAELEPVEASLRDLQDEVRDYFEWGEIEDLESAEDLLKTVEQSSVRVWERNHRSASISNLYRRLVIGGPLVAILGAAIEPEELIDTLESTTLLVIADGAAGVISEIPNPLSEKAWSRVACMVSDADGGEGTYRAARRSIPMVLHAHGDNREDWLELIRESGGQSEPPELILTHQTSSIIPGMHNPGGFTDGDRAACFLASLGVRNHNIRLLGTNSDSVGRWSGETHEPTKLEKLKWMEKSLRILGLWTD
ncbi:MAG: hypothetical protein CBD33_03395 [Euryarchaeota archaeon TMED173]|nr:MAG: hypothetical protein CBD33_03395 [Euryarchaeota archaeon TMED173]